MPTPAKISFPAPTPGSFAGCPPKSNPPSPPSASFSSFCSYLGGASKPKLAKSLFISPNASLLLAGAPLSTNGSLTLPTGSFYPANELKALAEEGLWFAFAYEGFCAAGIALESG